MSKYEGVSRNSNCPCGSGNRFKHCHGSNETNTSQKANTSILNNNINEDLFSADVYFCTTKGKFYTIDEAQFLFVADDTKEKIQLDQLSQFVFNDLAVFDNYENHFLRCTRLTGIDKHQFRRLIKTLIENNLLLMASDVVSSLNDSRKMNATSLAGIAIRTCESPIYLKRIIESQIRRKQKYFADENIYIFDDSSKQSTILENKAIVESFSKVLNITYCGSEWQETFVESISNEFSSASELKELLLPQNEVSFSGGRILNLEILFFAGKCFLHFDDDFILDDARLHNIAIDESKRVQIGTKSNVHDGFNSKEDVMNYGVKIDSDPLFQHKKVLGLKLSEFIANREDLVFDAKSLIGKTNSDTERYKSDSIIVTTGNGWIGTSGNRDARTLFQTDYKGMKAPWETATNFTQLLNGGYCWHSGLRTEFIEKSSNIPSGINNTQFLPPTIASCKSEDSFLCSLISAIYPTSVHLSFPWALVHLRMKKNWENETYQEARPLQVLDILNTIIANIQLPSSATNFDRTEFVVVSLERLNGLSHCDFLSELRQIYLSSVTIQIEQMYVQLSFIQSKKIRAIVEKIIKNDLSHLYKEELPQIEDAIGNSEFEQVQWLKKELGNYAKLLKFWPKLWQFCKNKL